MHVHNRRRLVEEITANFTHPEDSWGAWHLKKSAEGQQAEEAESPHGVGDSDVVQTDIYIAEQTNLKNTQPEGHLLHILLHLSFLKEVVLVEECARARGLNWPKWFPEMVSALHIYITIHIK